MQRDPREDFEHPRLLAGDPLRTHVCIAWSRIRGAVTAPRMEYEPVHSASLY
jgi:hypothetical protein